jgi:hypothetical protein
MPHYNRGLLPCFRITSQLSPKPRGCAALDPPGSRLRADLAEVTLWESVIGDLAGRGPVFAIQQDLCDSMGAEHELAQNASMSASACRHYEGTTLLSFSLVH